MKVLTPAAIANLRPRSEQYEVGDLGCRSLWVCIFPSGAKSFVCRYRFDGRSRKLTLGPCLIERDTIEPAAAPELGSPLSLAAARSLAAEAMRLAKSGTDPAAAKQRKREQERAAALSMSEAPSESAPKRRRKKRNITERDRQRSRERRRQETLAYRALKHLGLEHLLTTIVNQQEQDQ